MSTTRERNTEKKSALVRLFSPPKPKPAKLRSRSLRLPIANQNFRTIGIEIPSRVKAHLLLDAQRSWIIVTELNNFVWPGLDLYPVPGGRPDQYDYGFLPPILLKQVIDAILALDATRKRLVERTQ